MKINITKSKGVVQERDGSSIEIEDQEYHEAPFDHRWTDLIGELHEGSGAAALTYEGYRDTGFFMRFFRHNQNDNVFVTYQMPHLWDPTTEVYPHVHFVPMASTSGTVKFEYSYVWAKVGSTIPAGVSWPTGTILLGVSASWQYTHRAFHFGAIAPSSGATESTLLFFKMERTGNDAGDTYSGNKDHGTTSANFGILSFDLHYQSIKAGTVDQFPEVVE